MRRKQEAKSARQLVEVFESDDKGPASTPNKVEQQDQSSSLALIDIQSGKVRQVPIKGNLVRYLISPDGDYLAYTIDLGRDPKFEPRHLSSLLVMDLKTRTIRTLASSTRMAGRSFSWSPDSKRIAFTTNDFTPLDIFGDCYIVSREGGEPQNVTPGMHPSFGEPARAPLWDSTGSSIYLLPYNFNYVFDIRPPADSLWKVSVDGGSATQLLRIPGYTLLYVVTNRDNMQSRVHAWDAKVLVLARCDETKEMSLLRVNTNTGAYSKELEEPVEIGGRNDGHVSDPQIETSSNGGVIVYFAEDAQHPVDIWKVKPDLKSAKRVTNMNPSLAGYRMGASRMVKWMDLAGHTMRGALLLPAMYESGKRYPLIVRVYPGGSSSDYANCFGLTFGGAAVDKHQLLATRGYAVLELDSAVYTNTPMRSIADSVLPGINMVIARGIADPNRIGVIGHSFGGYGVTSLLVQSTRFRAAVDSAGGYQDMFSMAGIMGSDGTDVYNIYGEITKDM